jgi:hypothetical protein
MAAVQPENWLRALITNNNQQQQQQQGSEKRVSRYDECLNCGGDHVEM